MLSAGMRLSDEEMILFNSACSNPENVYGQDLLNVFGAERAVDVIEKMTTMPLGILVEVVAHLWHALTFESSRLSTPDFILFDGMHDPAATLVREND